MILILFVTCLLFCCAHRASVVLGSAVAKSLDSLYPQTKNSGYYVKFDALKAINVDDERVGITNSPTMTLNSGSVVNWQDIQQHTVARIVQDQQGTHPKRSLRILRIHNSLYYGLWDSSVSGGNSFSISNFLITNAHSNEGVARRLSQILKKQPLKLIAANFIVPTDLDSFANNVLKYFPNLTQNNNNNNNGNVEKIDASKVPEWDRLFKRGNEYFAVTKSAKNKPNQFNQYQLVFQFTWEASGSNTSTISDPSTPDKSGISVTDKIMIGVMVAVGVSVILSTTAGIFVAKKRSKKELEKDMELVKEALEIIPADQLKQLLEDNLCF